MTQEQFEDRQRFLEALEAMNFGKPLDAELAHQLRRDAKHLPKPQRVADLALAQSTLPAMPEVQDE
jgi:hypothetical protein